MATEEVDRDSLEQYRLTSVPRSLYYIPNFITAEEASHLLDNVNSPAARWTVLSHRRLQAIPSPLSTKDILLASPIPNWLESPIIPRLLALKHDDKSLFSNAPHKKPNHVLVNEYQPGQGIMPHEDGAAYWPVVATVSLGSPLVLDIYGKDTHDLRETEPRYRLLQEPLSLLITADQMYTDFLHGITDILVDGHLNVEGITNWSLLGSTEPYRNGSHERSTRTSLTYRDVLKVSNLGSKLKLFRK